MYIYTERECVCVYVCLCENDFRRVISQRRLEPGTTLKVDIDVITFVNGVRGDPSHRDLRDTDGEGKVLRRTVYRKHISHGVGHVITKTFNLMLMDP